MNKRNNITDGGFSQEFNLILGNANTQLIKGYLTYDAYDEIR